MIVPIMVRTEKYLPLIDEVMGKDRVLLVVTRQEEPGEETGSKQLPRVGTVCTLHKVTKGDEGTIVVVQGLTRGAVTEIVSEDPYIQAKVQKLEEEEKKSQRVDALKANLLKQFSELVALSPHLPGEIVQLCRHVEDPSPLADMIAAYIGMARSKKQEILECLDVEARLEKLTLFLNQELEIGKMGQQIQSQIQKGIDKSQREYYLREQLKIIQKELGGEEEGSPEIRELKERLKKKGLPEAAAKVAEKEIEKLSKMHTSSSEYTVTLNYLDWLLDLPWSESTPDILDLKKAEKVLNRHHYDLQKVKKRILEYLAVRKLNPTHKGPILCLAGPPGTGKTSLGRSIAEAMGRKFVRVSLGGVRDEAEIRGHRRTYVGALPGKIIYGIKKAGSNNPVFMLDEIDKLGADFRGDPASALLEVLDPEQNYSFSDHYIETDFDLSRVMFITTANQLDTIPRPLLDRMEVLELPGYTEYEKVNIARKFLIPRQVKEHGLERNRISFARSAVEKIIREYTRESGVRNLEREIGAVCRGVARRIAGGEKGRFVLRAERVRDYLGMPKFTEEPGEERKGVPGIATGMAWTPTGGDLLFVEATMMPGQKSLVLTGQLGEVMKESAQAALSYLRSKAGSFGIPEDFFKDHDLHIHVPAGAIPKDGPSAGVTIAMALLSLFTGRPARRDVALTGELTLTGRVLPVAGVREKLLAAQRAGVRKVILPRKNQVDLEAVPEKIRSGVELHLIESLEEAVDLVLVPAQAERSPRQDIQVQ
jgi:ATP-dependent Lon protease